MDERRPIDPGYPGGELPQSESERHGFREQTRRIGDAARERAFSSANERKGTLAEQLAGFADGMEGQGQAGAKLSGWLKDAQHALETRSAEDLVKSAEQQMRAHPGLFAAGCVALGFLAARLVRG